mgnify:FL=1
MKKLTAAAIKNSKPIDKQRKSFGGGGLYLLIKTHGARYWRYDYRHTGTRKALALGVYAEVPLKQAREKHHSFCFCLTWIAPRKRRVTAMRLRGAPKTRPMLYKAHRVMMSLAHQFLACF